MSNLKQQSVSIISKLFRSNGDRAFERSLKKQVKEPCYTAVPLPHVYSNRPY